MGANIWATKAITWQLRRAQISERLTGTAVIAPFSTEPLGRVHNQIKQSNLCFEFTVKRKLCCSHSQTQVVYWMFLEFYDSINPNTFHIALCLPPLGILIISQLKKKEGGFVIEFILMKLDM